LETSPTGSDLRTSPTSRVALGRNLDALQETCGRELTPDPLSEFASASSQCPI
jgi:hypothetical protein